MNVNLDPPLPYGPMPVPGHKRRHKPKIEPTKIEPIKKKRRKPHPPPLQKRSVRHGRKSAHRTRPRVNLEERRPGSYRDEKEKEPGGMFGSRPLRGPMAMPMAPPPMGGPMPMARGPPPPPPVGGPIPMAPPPPMVLKMPMPMSGPPRPRMWSSIRKTNPGEFWAIIVFTFFVMIGIGVGLYFLVKMLLGDCGEDGKKPCPSGCDEGLVEDSGGICRSSVSCGAEGQSPCEGTGCSVGFVLGSSGVCVVPVCGADGQAPCPGGEDGCIEGFFLEQGTGVCKRLCSTKDQKPCPGEKCNDGLMEGLSGKCVDMGAALLGYGGVGAVALLAAGGATALVYYRGGRFLRRFRRGSRVGAEENDREFSVDARVKDLLSRGFLVGGPRAKTFADLQGVMNMVQSAPQWTPRVRRSVIGNLERLAEKMIADPNYNPGVSDIATELNIRESEVEDGILYGEAMIQLRSAPLTIRTEPKFQAWYDRKYPNATPEQKQKALEVFRRFRKIQTTQLTSDEQEEMNEAVKFTKNEFSSGEGGERLLVGLPEQLANRPFFGSADEPAERLILYGDPGTGKTMWVRRLTAQNPDVIVFKFDTADKSIAPGAAETRLRSIFSAITKLRAEGKAAFLMMDEADGILDENSPGGQPLALLAQNLMSSPQFDVPVVMMTNFPKKIPGAIKNRSFSIEVKLPTRSARAMILRDKIAELTRSGRQVGFDVESAIGRISKMKFNGRDAEKAFKRIEGAINDGEEFTEEMIRKMVTESMGDREMGGKRRVRDRFKGALGVGRR